MMGQTVEVIVPYWGSDPQREASLEYVLARLKAERLPVKVARSDGPAPKAAVLWPVLRKSNADVLVIHDADLWCEGLPAAIDTVINGEFVWARPHRNVVRLAADSSAFYMTTGELPGRREIRYDRTPYLGVTGGGIVVARAEVLLDVVMDPRFEGWGQEDMALGNAIWTLYGPPHIGDLDLIHLYHEPLPRVDHMWGSEANRELYTRYHKATVDPSAMLALVAEAHHALEAH
jgi:hypothetical protein